jgi:hypothetical protein
MALLAVAGAPARPANAAGVAVKLDADRYLQDYRLITLDPDAARREVAEHGMLTISAGLDRYDVALAPHDLRAPSYRAEETLEDGSHRVLPAQPVNTYAGSVANREGATARFTMEAGRLTGMIIDGDDRVFVEPLATFSLAGGPTDYVVYHEYDVRPDAEPGACGVSEAEKVSSALDGVAGEATKTLTTASQTVQLATEADNEYVTALGSAAAANSDILTIVNQIDGVYQAELGLAFQVVLQNTYAGADPYSSTDPSTMLTEFRNYWNANRTNVARDIAHMWSGRDMDGSVIGIAYVGVVCSAPTYSYGVSQRWTGAPQRYILSAHEIGHNFNACHSNSSCNPNPSPCDNTIMQSSVGTGFTFCQFSRDQINSWVAGNGSCLASSGGSTPPAAPSNLTAAPLSTTQVSVGWADNSSNESGFKIERKTGSTGTYGQIATTGAGVTSYTDTSGAPGTTYVYRVRATNSGGDSSYSNEASATTQSSPPAAPSSLTATPVSRTQVNLAWVDNSSNESGFKIERSSDGVSFAQIASVGANVVSYSNTGLHRNRTYYYRVRSTNASGDSAYSNTAVARTPRRSGG